MHLVEAGLLRSRTCGKEVSFLRSYLGRRRDVGPHLTAGRRGVLRPDAGVVPVVLGAAGADPEVLGRGRHHEHALQLGVHHLAGIALPLEKQN